MEQTAGHTHVLLVTYVEFPSLRVPGMNYAKRTNKFTSGKTTIAAKNVTKGNFYNKLSAKHRRSISFHTEEYSVFLNCLRKEGHLDIL